MKRDHLNNSPCGYFCPFQFKSGDLGKVKTLTYMQNQILFFHRNVNLQYIILRTDDKLPVG
jgi:hypothetical protein